MNTKSVRIIMEVTAGIVPEEPIKEWTKQYYILSEEWHKADDKQKQILMTEAYGQASAYACLILNPAAVNWVRTDWIYL